MDKKVILKALGAVKFLSKRVIETANKERYRIQKAYFTGEDTFILRMKAV